MEGDLQQPENLMDYTRKTVSRVVLIVFCFVLLCLVVPSVTGDVKGIPSVRWYGYAVISAGIAALVAGQVARHRCRVKLGKPHHANASGIPIEVDGAELVTDEADNNPNILSVRRMEPGTAVLRLTPR